MNRIKFLRSEFQMTQQELADKLNLVKGSIAMYENETRKPSLEVLIKLSEIFNCSIDYILCKTDIREQYVYADEFSKLEENYFKKIIEPDGSISYKSNFEKVPIVGKIAAGQPILVKENIEGFLPVDPNIYGLNSSDDLFFLKVAGQSMNLKVKNGDYALIHKQDYAENGDIIVAIVNGDDEATLKRYKRLNEQFVLLEPMSTDPSIEAITVDLKNSKFQIIGKAIGQFGKF